MAKTNNPRRVAATEARAKLVNVRISPQKLNLVAASIRGLPVQRALNELEFSRKRIATDVRKVLYSAVSNAENNHNLDIDNLVVAEAFVGKNLVMKRFASRARGRSTAPSSSCTVPTSAVAERCASFGAGWCCETARPLPCRHPCTAPSNIAR